MGTLGDKVNWPAGVPFSKGASILGRLSKFGGTLSLEEDAAVFVPIGGMGRARRFPFAEISAVEPWGVQPSRLLIRLRDGTESVFIVARQRMTGITDEDVSARDEAVAAIRARTASS